MTIEDNEIATLAGLSMFNGEIVESHIVTIY